MSRLLDAVTKVLDAWHGADLEFFTNLMADLDAARDDELDTQPDVTQLADGTLQVPTQDESWAAHISMHAEERRAHSNVHREHLTFHNTERDAHRASLHDESGTEYALDWPTIWGNRRDVDQRLAVLENDAHGH